MPFPISKDTWFMNNNSIKSFYLQYFRSVDHVIVLDVILQNVLQDVAAAQQATHLNLYVWRI